MFLRGSGEDDVVALIAIHGQREYAVECRRPIPRLVLQFDDSAALSAIDPIAAARIRIRQREAAEIGLRLSPPTIEHARAILNFGEMIQPLDGTLLCHCLAGISRSPAAALICLALWMGPGREDECVARIRQGRPAAIPHADLVAFADELLGRRGNLVAALARADQ